MAKSRPIYYDQMVLDNLRQQYENIYVAMFDWKGLPEEIPKFAPERYLYRQGLATMFMLPASDKFAILPVSIGSVQLDVYGYPTEWRAFATGNSPQATMIKNTVLNEDNAVLIWNNQLYQSDLQYVDFICKKMCMLDKTIDINNLVQRTPYIIKTDGQNQLTAKNIYKEFYDGTPAVMDANFDVSENIEVLNLGVTFIGDKLSDQYETYHNRILRYFAIDHLPVEKQERMLSGEASANDEEILIRAKTRLDFRKYSCDKINKLWNLGVSVDYVKPDEPTELSVSGTSSNESGNTGIKGQNKNPIQKT